MADIGIGGKHHEFVAQPPIKTSPCFRLQKAYFTEGHPNVNVLAFQQFLAQFAHCRRYDFAHGLAEAQTTFEIVQKRRSKNPLLCFRPEGLLVIWQNWSYCNGDLLYIVKQVIRTIVFQQPERIVAGSVNLHRVENDARTVNESTVIQLRIKAGQLAFDVGGTNRTLPSS